LTNITPVVATVCDDVEKDFFSGHAPAVPVGKLEVDDFGEIGCAQACSVVLVPSIGGRHIGPQLSKGGRALGVRGVEGPWLGAQVGLEDAINDVDVVQRSDTCVEMFCVLGR